MAEGAVGGGMCSRGERHGRLELEEGEDQRGGVEAGLKEKGPGRSAGPSGPKEEKAGWAKEAGRGKSGRPKGKMG